MFHIQWNCIVAIFRVVILKDVLHRTSNNCLMCYVIVLRPSSER